MRIEADLDLIDHFEYDRCGNTTVAILTHGENAVTIPLCSECLSELRNSLIKYDNTIFCHQCNNFVMSDSGWKYGGRCNKHNKDVDCINTCEDATSKETNEIVKCAETIKNYCSGTTCCQECNFFRGLKIKRDCDDINIIQCELNKGCCSPCNWKLEGNNE